MIQLYKVSKENKVSIVKLRVLSHVLSWLTSGQVYEMSRADPEIRFVMGWPTNHHQITFFEL